jgi:hypothetical protein
VGCNTILILLFFGIWIFSSVLFCRVVWSVLDKSQVDPAPSSILLSDSDFESDASDSDSEKAEIKVLQPGKRDGSSKRVKREGSSKCAKSESSSQLTAKRNGSRIVGVPPGKCECFGCKWCRGANEGQCTRLKRLERSPMHCHPCHMAKKERNIMAIVLKLDLNCRAEYKCPKCDQVFESSELFLYHFQSAHWFQFIEDQNISCIDCGISARHAIFDQNGPYFTQIRCVECNVKRGYEGTKKRIRRCKGQTAYDVFVRHEGLLKAKNSDICERW